ncbi:MAG TPA: 4Fe-4S dicluster domain-containing protein [Candidatus Binatia bacterium]|nr:4Fe-4S dicluster domain-containing protein [Candidatus Binatia bacterium]
MRSGKPNSALLIFSVLVAITIFPLADVIWVRVGEKAFAISLFLLAISLGPCLTYYAVAAKPRKQVARKLVLFTGGLSIISFAVLGKANVDLEGFFMLLFLGTTGAAIGHTLITVVIGPLFFGRFLCGWGCWRAMILELLPLTHSPGRRSGAWKVVPFFGLGLSVSASAASVFLFADRPGGMPGAMHSGGLRGILIGVAAYYAASISMAFALRDQRAFCKYLCPSGLILGMTSRPSILKMTPTAQLCNRCGACTKVCPMDIDVAHFAALGNRVRSGQCILCQRCANVCPTGALRLAPRI